MAGRSRRTLSPGDGAFPALPAAAGFLLAAAVALLARPVGARAAPTAPAQDPPPAAAPAEEPPTCKECHEDVQESALVSIHGKVVADPVLDSCEMCHAGGLAHRRAMAAGEKPTPGGGFAKPVDCLLCHRTIPERHAKSMPAWRERRDAACTTCHQAHRSAAEAKAARALGPFADAAAMAAAGARPAGAAACAKCHDAPVKGFAGTGHGRVLAEKGETACEACHGPASLHAANSGAGRLVLKFPAADAAAAARFCLRCHEKDGPEHARDFAKSKEAAGGRTCASCHRVHGPAADVPGEGFQSLSDARAGAKEVGAAACLKCHVDPHPGLAASRHAPLMAKDREGCEACHGPGSAHVDSGGRASLILDPERLKPRARDGICLQCHDRTAPAAQWARHPHASAGVACLDCHDPVAPAGRPTRRAEPALCAKCHERAAGMARMPNHHPLDEGGVRCSDCHDPHRARPAVFAGKQWTETCAKCHRTEGAPRLYPHEADRADGCIVCHEPHGGPAPRLLRFSRVADLCLSCHVPPATHDLAAGSAYASCLACHGQIHGSDVHPKLLR